MAGLAADRRVDDDNAMTRWSQRRFAPELVSDLVPETVFTKVHVLAEKDPYTQLAIHYNPYRVGYSSVSRGPALRCLLAGSHIGRPAGS
jgi:hypothetical protein